MDNLQDLVVGSLPDVAESDSPVNSFEPRPPLEVLAGRESVSCQDLLRLCHTFRQEMADRPEQTTYLLAQLLAYTERSEIPPYSFGPHRKMLPAFALAATYTVDPSEDNRNNLLEWLDKTQQEIEDYIFAGERNRLIGGITSQIDFLADFFGDDLAEELAALGDVRPQTAKRWLTGSQPTWYNQQKIQLLARMFYAARHQSSLSDKEAVLWYRESFRGGPSPQDMMSSFSGSYISDQLREALDFVGCRGEY